ncbi:sigma-E processing peptidase SpoIIGA [Aneurinibacillus sp. Ricciae_BoGa-3]|uniref:sigma-E processing peptidase SpoIIGA n=1 Tax=Aneurinibacillus sp. Ricciae_BoGa-3 TaxID=3022697 RepID=UPI0023425058|nr:sigma-E processing peptidase SpoIIGA [Aneurinibacillus sp. Ricciae_BoGa-3]WCK56842.1 sigma-E processing peptidase SpoIIGA [Aneurinibacillus sp. Ricciae_BoGa-3]
MYADVIFVVNFIIDFMLLAATAYFCRVSLRRRRTALASTCGALYTLFLFFPPLSFAYTLFWKFIFSCLMILISFGRMQPRKFIRVLVSFYCISFFIGGGLFAIHYLFQQQNVILNGIAATRTGAGLPVSGPSLLLIAAGFPLLWWLSKKGYKGLEACRQQDVQHVDVLVTIGEKNVRCVGFIDTGNQLHDPLTRTPVSIMELSLWENVLPDNLLEAVRKGTGFDTDLSAIDEQWLPRIRLIPYRTVSAQMSFLLAIRPDAVTIQTNGEAYEGKMYIGLRAESLSSAGSYQAIIHPKALVHKQAS